MNKVEREQSCGLEGYGATNVKLANNVLAKRELLIEVQMINKTVAIRAMIKVTPTSTIVQGQPKLPLSVVMEKIHNIKHGGRKKENA